MRAVIALVLIAGCSGGKSTSTGPQQPPGKPDPALLAGLAAPDRAAAAIDPGIGLVFIDHFQAPGDDVPPPRGELHLCGAKLADFVHASWAEIADAITRETAHVQCAGLVCRAGGSGEWDPVLHFYFVGKPGGVWLRAIAISDEVSVPEAKTEAEHAKQRDAIAKLAQPCAK